VAVTHGHGNPDWTRDEVILALELYFDCGGSIPGSTDTRIVALSQLLRAIPYHSEAARRESFRNPAGVSFKLQNLRQVATERGLPNVSQTDRDVWRDFGNDPTRVKQLARLIRDGIAVVAQNEIIPDDEVFFEGRMSTQAHYRKERDPKLRKRLLSQRRKIGALTCDICEFAPILQSDSLSDAVFEVHHVIPFAGGDVRETKLKDVALLCANCHRLVHRAIVERKQWLTMNDAAIQIFGTQAFRP
jgi:5-methylcytosine-specific restriction protein A